MTRILVLNGPNLGATLGSREPGVYGSATFGDIDVALRERAAALDVTVRFAHSNSEGDLITMLEEEASNAAACVINPGALSHTSVALLDALRTFPGPVIEVHLTNVFNREPYRRVLVTAEAAEAVICGLGLRGYIVGLEAAVRLVRERAQ